MTPCHTCGNDAYEGAQPYSKGARRKYCPPCKKVKVAADLASPRQKAYMTAYRAKPENKARESSPERKAAHAANYFKTWARQLAHNARTGVKRGSRKSRGLVSEITEAWVLEQYARQGGRCFYTGVQMVPSSNRRDPFRPSLERRNSNLGYLATEEQTVLVCLGANLAKSEASEETFRAWLGAVRLAA